jgi:dipeptidyl aminopeptidase/acylaminoacyl peptidase
MVDEKGDENWRLLSVDIDTGEKVALSPESGVQARVQQVSTEHPHEILIAINDRDPQFHDLYRVDVRTGKRKLIQENDRFNEFVTDADFRVRFAFSYTEEGGREMFRRAGGAWRRFMAISPEDALTTSVVGFSSGFGSGGGDGESLMYMIDSRGRDTSALVAIDLETGEERLLYSDPSADVSSVLIHPTTRRVDAASSEFTRERWVAIDPEIERDLRTLGRITRGDFVITSRSTDDRLWTVAFILDDGPVRYHLYDRRVGRSTELFTSRSALEKIKLAPMRPRVIEARDGLELVSYLTLPVGTDADGDGVPKRPLPMVLLVHGGPWARDTWGYDPHHQWLANRGYAVLSVNFRGSTGFGKSFTNAGNFEWGAAMHDDLIDAVDWAVREKIADEKRVAIMGASYGGYAALVGLTMTPDVFAAGVDIVGPSNLFTLLESIPPYWKTALDLFTSRVGDPDTREGRALLEARSPLNFVHRIKRPLLIGHGANDPRVKQTEADQIVDAMVSRNIPVTYALFPDEGHGFARPENRKAFNAITEMFLAQHLGGRYQPVDGDFKGASVIVPVGAEHIPGVNAPGK